MLHLDTNILILGSEPGHAAHRLLRQWVDDAIPVAVSAMAWAEFRCGPASASAVAAWEQAVGEAVIAIDREIAERASLLLNHTGRRSRSLPDCIIAATAIMHGARLATLNRADFAAFRTHGLELA
ncbi:MAG: PIN domain-containing protein [Rhodanobacteraceae bacterium]